MKNSIIKNISIVVIGRNEEAHIKSLAESIKKIQQICQCILETIFVDSASSDSSVELAKISFDTVIILKESSHLCAAAGRAVGTDIAKGEWILYLDADMIITDEFMNILSNLCKDSDPNIAGYIGSYINIFENGETQLTEFHSRNGQYASGLGGASLLSRSAVIEAGNWDSSIFAHEELDLFSRMRKKNWLIIALDLPMIIHFTEKLSVTKRLSSLLLPNGGAGKKYFGAGQLLASRISKYQFGFDVLRHDPYPLIIATPFVIALTLGIMTTPLSGLITFSILLIVITSAIGTSKLAIHGSKLVRIPFGIFKYRQNFKPEIETTWKRIEDTA